LTDLLNQHWVTPQSPFEQQSLAAINAYVDPPAGTNGFYAAAEHERDPVGPVPTADDDGKLEPLIDQFNLSRGRRTDPATINLLLAPIERHYRPLIHRTWMQVWDCRDREAFWPEAPSVKRRWEADREVYTQHIDWAAGNGRTRTRQTPRQAALKLRALEEAKARLQAEEACDDPLKMVPYILQDKAIQGRVLRISADHREMGNARMVRRPLVTVLSADPCLIPLGKELYWTQAPDGRSYIVEDVRPDISGGSIVTLKLTTGASSTPLPIIRSQACFSIHTTRTTWFANLPLTEPWSHRPLGGEPPHGAIEGEEHP